MKFSKSQRVLNGFKTSCVATLVIVVSCIIFFVDFDVPYHLSCITCELSFGELFSDSWFQVLLALVFIVAWVIGYSYTNQKDWDDKFSRKNEP